MNRLHLPPEGLGLRLASTGPFFSLLSSQHVPGGVASTHEPVERLLDVYRESRINFNPNRPGVRWLMVLAMLAAQGCDSPGSRLPDETFRDPLPAAPVVTESPSPKPIELPGGIVVDREAGEVVVPAHVSIDVGWLEQVVCARNTRDHEAILVVDVLPSQVHAALVLLGLEPGTPGHWRFEETDNESRPRVRRIKPVGDRVRVEIRRVDQDPPVTEPISGWIVDAEDDEAFTEQPWVFGGSTFFRPRPDSPELYAADQSGSLVGLVTFGDEVLGLGGVRSDQVDVDAAMWAVRTEVVPAPGTRVELVLRPWPED